MGMSQLKVSLVWVRSTLTN